MESSPAPPPPGGGARRQQLMNEKRRIFVSVSISDKPRVADRSLALPRHSLISSTLPGSTAWIHDAWRRERQFLSGVV
jgi:hypothetical protein